MNPFDGFRGYTMLQAIHLDGIIHRSLPEYSIFALKELQKAAPRNPVVRALRAVYDGGNGAEALILLDEICPGGECGYENQFGWQSIPDAIVYAWTVAILEGR